MTVTQWGENENLTLTDADLESELGGPVSSGQDKARAYCPVHGSDKQRSLEVDLTTGRFRCFAASCEAWGYMDWARSRYRAENGGKGSSERRIIAHRVPTTPRTVMPVRPDLDRLLERYQEALPGSWGERYLAMRGISLAVAQAAGVGYAAPGEWVGREWRGGRVVFAHRRADGRLINLYGRAVASKEEPGGLKHDHLPGNKAWFVAGSPRQTDTLYIAESALDALSLAATGAPAAIAVYGVDGLYWDWLPAGVHHLVLAFDDDEGGRSATEKLAPQASLRGYQVSVMDASDYGEKKDANAALVAGVLRVEPVQTSAPATEPPPEPIAAEDSDPDEDAGDGVDEMMSRARQQVEDEPDDDHDVDESRSDEDKSVAVETRYEKGSEEILALIEKMKANRAARESAEPEATS